MPRFRQQLPQLDGDPFLTDGGIETTLTFTEGLTLPELADLLRRLPSLNVLGGCCGTDHRHIEAIANAVVPSFPRSEMSRSA